MSQGKRKCCFNPPDDNSSCQGSNNGSKILNTQTCPWPGDGRNICFQPNIMFLCAQLVGSCQDSCQPCKKTCKSNQNGDGGGGSGGPPNGGGGSGGVGTPNGGGGDGNGGGGPPNGGGGPLIKKIQYTPKYSEVTGFSGEDCIRKLTAKTLTDPNYTNHGPSGMTRYDQTKWNNVKWDGQKKHPCNLTNKQLIDYAFPNGDCVMLGLREKYESLRPFADEKNPTVAEIDNWNFEVIRHFRSLWEIADKIPIEPSRELFLQAQWAKEYRDSNFWDSRYPPPGTPNCNKTQKIMHCGGGFFPKAEDQTPYLDGGAPVTSNNVRSEGLGSVGVTIPWWLKLSCLIFNFVGSEGRTGHPGPFWRRTCMGINFNCKENSDSVEVRIQNGCELAGLCPGEN